MAGTSPAMTKIKQLEMPENIECIFGQTLRMTPSRKPQPITL
jgi:hypothetical protein